MSRNTQRAVEQMQPELIKMAAVLGTMRDGR